MRRNLIPKELLEEAHIVWLADETAERHITGPARDADRPAFVDALQTVAICLLKQS